jgi:hypothetical protein
MDPHGHTLHSELLCGPPARLNIRGFNLGGRRLAAAIGNRICLVRPRLIPRMFGFRRGRCDAIVEATGQPGREYGPRGCDDHQAPSASLTGWSS